jgi:hypothetical protein
LPSSRSSSTSSHSAVLTSAPNNRPRVRVRRQHQHEFLRLAPQRVEQRRRAQAIVQRTGDAERRTLHGAAGGQNGRETRARVKPGEMGTVVAGTSPGPGGNDHTAIRQQRNA